MRILPKCIGLGLALAAGSMAAASEESPTKGNPTPSAARLEFQLPLPGEAIPPEGGGVLVQADSSIYQVLFKWFGPDSGSAEGKIQFEGFFQAQVPALKPGNWTLMAMGFDAQGHMNARRTIGFEVGRAFGTLPDIVPRARVVQDLYLAANSGLNFGTAQTHLKSYRSLMLGPDGQSAAGPEMTPLDQVYSGNASLVYHLQQGPFRLRTRLSTDASETFSHTATPSRMGMDLYWSSWVEGHLGDQYPDWSPLIMDGTRIRGAGAGLAFVVDGNALARVDYTFGYLRSAIKPQIRTWDDLVDTVPSQLLRTIQAGHVGFNGKSTSLNFTILHSRDQIGGVDMKLHDALNGTSPRENTGISTDFTQRFLANRLEVYWSSALTMTTDDTREGSFFDSLADAQDLPLPGFLSDVALLNLSTRGVDLLTRNSPRIDEFLWENAAIRAGGRVVVPIGGFGRLRLDSRWIHYGAYYQSFAKSFQENSRSGWEWSATSAMARDALLLMVSGAEVSSHPAYGIDLPTHTVNATLAWSPVSAPIGWNLQSGQLSSGGGVASNRSESWNAGGGFFGTLHAPDRSPVFWKANYGYYENSIRLPVSVFDSTPGLSADSQFTTRSIRSRVQTQTLDASLRWRPIRDFECRGGYLLASQGIPTDTNATNQTRTHRFQVGTTHWGLSRQLEVALDGSYVARPDQIGDSRHGWDQSLRTNWEFAESQTLRLSERWGRLSGDRTDLRLEIGWEAWF